MSASKLEPAVMQAYTQILHNELKEALGCTEPIAIAYAAAYATKLLGRLAEHFRVSCSGNIIKNVKAVTVPQTGGMTGIEAAVLIGAIGGDADLGMQVLTCVTDADRETLRACMEKHMVEVSLLESEHVLHIVIEATSGSDCVSVEIIDSHTQLGTVITTRIPARQRRSAIPLARSPAPRISTSIARFLSVKSPCIPRPQAPQRAAVRAPHAPACPPD